MYLLPVGPYRLPTRLLRAYQAIRLGDSRQESQGSAVELRIGMELPESQNAFRRLDALGHSSLLRLKDRIRNFKNASNSQSVVSLFC